MSDYSPADPTQLDAVAADRLGLDLVRVTEAAALGVLPFIGRGDPHAADAAAVHAMRECLATVNVAGLVVIGEGEKDNAPWLFNGERVGTGLGVRLDVAVDPIDGTKLTAAGKPNALSMLAVADRGSMFDARAVFYMEKLVCGPAGAGVVDIRLPIGENIRNLARATGVQVADMQVAVLDKPRHRQLVAEIRTAGATPRLLPDGDVLGGINAARAGSPISLCVGIGGTPEGILTACAVKALGGIMQGRLRPQHDDERERAIAAGHDFEAVLSAEDLVRGENAWFVATGITGSDLLGGVHRRGAHIETHSVIMHARTGTVRRVQTSHHPREGVQPPTTR